MNPSRNKTLLALLSLAAAVSLQAQTTYYWTATGGGDWKTESDPAWSTTGTPENGGTLNWGTDIADSLTNTNVTLHRDTFATDVISLGLAGTVEINQFYNFAVATTITDSGSGLIRLGAGGVSAGGAQDLVINTGVEFTTTPSAAITGDVVINGAVSGGDGVTVTTGVANYTVFDGSGGTFSGTVVTGTGSARLAVGSTSLQSATVQHDTGVVNFLSASITLGGLSGSADIEMASRNSFIDGNDRNGVILTVGGNGRDTTFSGNLLNPSNNLGGQDAALIKTGSGTLTLSGINTYIGTTSVDDGSLILDGTHTGAGDYSIASGAVLGGNGSISGNAAFASGALLVFDPLETLTISGTVSMDNSFSVTSLVNADGTAIDWSGIDLGTYTLIGATGSDFSNITNFGSGSAADLGGGKSAYFQNGSLQLVVIPEPSTFVLFGLAGVAAMLGLRRRRS